MNRRELLASFLGVPLAITAGCRSSLRLPEEGGFVGPSHEAGHRIRDGYRPEPAPEAWVDVDVVIVGGGVAGLTAARRLKQSKLRFVVLELEAEVGGTSVSGESPLVPYPWGAHYIPVPLPHNHVLIDLLDEMGVLEGRSQDGAPIVAEQHLCRAPQERLFLDGEWREGLYPWYGVADGDLQQLERFQSEINQLVAHRNEAGRRPFTIPVHGCSRESHIMQLDSQSMLDWMLERNLTSPRLRWYVDYACRDDYGLRVDQTSAWAGLFYFAARVREAGEESQPFITWPEGNGRLVSHLREMCRESIETGVAVYDVTSSPGESDQEAAEVRAFRQSGSTTGEAVGWRARKVIFAAPPFMNRHLIMGYRESGPKSIASFEFGSWLVANLHLSGRPAESGFPLSWDNVLYDSPSLGYVAATHQVGRDYGPTVLTWYYPLCDDSPGTARKRLLSLSWEEWAEVIMSDLERAHPEIRFLTRRLDIMRWGHAMIRPTPGFIGSSARSECARPFGNVHFAHSSLSGIPLFEEAFYHGNRAAQEVLEALHV